MISTTPKLRSYRKLSELIGLLQEAGDGYWLVPSSADRPQALELLRQVNPKGTGRQILLWDGLYILLARLAGKTPLRQVDPPDHWLLLNYARDQIQDLTPPKGGDTDAYLDAAGDLFKELLAENMGPETLSESHPYESALFDCYLQTLQNTGSLDPSDLPTQSLKVLNTLEQGQRAKIPKLVALGFMSLTANQKALMDDLVESGVDVTILVPDPGDMEVTTLFDQYGLPQEATFSPLQGLVIEAPDHRGRAEDLARALKAWEVGQGPLAHRPFVTWEDVGLWCPQSDGAKVCEALDRYQVPYRLGIDKRVSDTNFWRAARAARELAHRDFPRLATERFLGLDSQGSVHLSWGTLLPHGLKAWSILLGPGEGTQALEEAQKLAQDLDRTRSPYGALIALHNWGTACLRRLRAHYANQPEGDRWVREWVATLNLIQEKIDALAPYTIKDSGLLHTIHQVKDSSLRWNYLVNWAQGTRLPPPLPVGDALTLWIGSLPQLSHQKIWGLIGGESDAWPGKMNESPLVSDKEKENFSLEGPGTLPTLAELKARQLALLRRYTAAGDELTLLVNAKADEKGREKSLAPILEDARWWHFETVDLSDLCLTWADGHGLLEERPSQLLWREAPGQREPLEEVTLTPSKADTFAQCPFAWYLEAQLKIPQAPKEGFDPLKGGIMVHSLWEDQWRKKLTGQIESLSQNLTEAYEEAIKNHYPQLDDLELRAHRRRLQTTLEPMAQMQEEQASLLDQFGPQTIDLEENLPKKTIGRVTLKAKADRSHNWPNRKLFFDYKSGKAENYKKSLQQALYALTTDAPDQCSWAFLGQKGPSFVLAADEELASALRGDKKSSQRRDELLKEAHNLIDELNDRAQKGDFAPNYGSPRCRRCPYTPLCRKGEFKALKEEDDDLES